MTQARDRGIIDRDERGAGGGKMKKKKEESDNAELNRAAFDKWQKVWQV